jgi:hypothetical protein
MHTAEEQLDSGVIGRGIHEHVIDLIHDGCLLGGKDGVENALQDLGLIGKVLLLLLCVGFSVTDSFTGKLLKCLNDSLEGGQLRTHWCGNKVQGNVNEPLRGAIGESATALERRP